MMRLRSACESEEPATALICVVSAVSRLISSPECVRSKKAGPSVGDVAEDVAAQIGDDALAEPVDVVEARGAGDREDEADDDQHGEVAVDE